MDEFLVLLKELIEANQGSIEAELEKLLAESKLSPAEKDIISKVVPFLYSERAVIKKDCALFCCSKKKV